jgi:hypothetical protein
MNTAEKIEMHRAFWEGRGPSLILIPTGDQPRYDTAAYRELFENPKKMWESEIARAGPVPGWPTDGIPTVRPNLGVTFVPAIAGQDYELRDGHMPWPGKPMSVERIRAIRGIDVTGQYVMKLAESFYRVHAESGDGETVPYQPDTQGIFDVAHLLYGEEIFYDIMYPGKAAWIDELLDIARELITAAAFHTKKLAGERDREMIHGHSTQQGLFFPHTGLRIAEDAVTLIPPACIDRFVMPQIEKAAAPFGGVFMHFCGRHEPFFERLCRCEAVKAIDLGDPEMYDIRWLLRTAADTGTVIYSWLGAEAGENWRDYTGRLGRLVKETGARCVLRPRIWPDSRDDCAAMQRLWHDQTS